MAAAREAGTGAHAAAPSHAPSPAAPEAVDGSEGRGERFGVGFHRDARGFATAYQDAVPPDEHLQRTAQEASSDYASFGSFGESHVGEALADLAVEENRVYGERGAFGQVCQGHGGSCE